MDIKKLAEKYNEYIIDRRRYFHQHPELSYQEVDTTEAIIKELQGMDIEVKRFEGLHGCVGILKGGKPGKTVLLRADIDGLPVVERTGLPFASTNDNMHACGHDCHIAMQLGAAKILSEIREVLSGMVKFFFQPGEEIASGAKNCIEQGLLDEVDACYGTHIWSQIDSPKINIEGGPRMASCDTFTLTVRGTSSHGSAPHLGKDAIVAASALVMGIQTLVSRENDPLSPLVISIGTIEGGQRFNIIANEVTMSGTVRTFSKEVRNTMEGKIRDMALAMAKAYGCTSELEYNYLTGPVINEDAELVQLTRNSATELYGDEFLANFEKITGSEDFAYLQEKVPGVYCFIGCRNPEIPDSELPNHHERFTVDEDLLHRGAGVAAQFAYDYLEKNS